MTRFNWNNYRASMDILSEIEKNQLQKHVKKVRIKRKNIPCIFCGNPLICHKNQKKKIKIRLIKPLTNHCDGKLSDRNIPVIMKPKITKFEINAFDYCTTTIRSMIPGAKKQDCYRRCQDFIRRLDDYAESNQDSYIAQNFKRFCLWKMIQRDSITTPQKLNEILIGLNRKQIPEICPRCS